VDCGDMLRGANELDVIQEGTEYTKQVSSARLAQLESIRTDLRGLSISPYNGGIIDALCPYILVLIRTKKP
jgi:hypothetical protein